MDREKQRQEVFFRRWPDVFWVPARAPNRVRETPLRTPAAARPDSGQLIIIQCFNGILCSSLPARTALEVAEVGLSSARGTVLGSPAL
jgi:hypothetical protein